MQEERKIKFFFPKVWWSEDWLKRRRIVGGEEAEEEEEEWSGVKIRWGEREEKKRAKKVERKPAYFYTSTQPEYAALIAV